MVEGLNVIRYLASVSQHKIDESLYFFTTGKTQEGEKLTVKKQSPWHPDTLSVSPIVESRNISSWQMVGSGEREFKR